MFSLESPAVKNKKNVEKAAYFSSKNLFICVCWNSFPSQQNVRIHLLTSNTILTKTKLMISKFHEVLPTNLCEIQEKGSG